ncbi:MAG TPA: hypothetical protein VMF69_15255, partial [Gemmataceae bacterium]|nr:hypothetical protein [Gemmataceae bacterium]
TGYRTTPDVSFVADPDTGVWIADTYNLPASDPFEIAGGTSLSAPSWAGLLALVNQGRAANGQAALNSNSPTQTQEALYTLPQSDFNSITSGTNGGYTAAAGYNLVTGLGTPKANLLVPGLIAYTGSGGTTGTPASSSSSSANNGGISFNAFDALTDSTSGLGYLQSLQETSQADLGRSIAPTMGTQTVSAAAASARDSGSSDAFPSSAQPTRGDSMEMGNSFVFGAIAGLGQQGFTTAPQTISGISTADAISESQPFGGQVTYRLHALSADGSSSATAWLSTSMESASVTLENEAAGTLGKGQPEAKPWEVKGFSFAADLLAHSPATQQRFAEERQAVVDDLFTGDFSFDLGGDNFTYDSDEGMMGRLAMVLIGCSGAAFAKERSRDLGSDDPRQSRRSRKWFCY